MTIRMPVGGRGGAELRCDSITVRSATVTDADLGWVPVFPATVRVTVPLPVPVAPAVMLIQEVCSDADHLQPTGEVTSIVTAPPAGPTDCDLGDTV